jgi:hypothetical protein
MLKSGLVLEKNNVGRAHQANVQVRTSERTLTFYIQITVRQLWQQNT